MKMKRKRVDGKPVGDAQPAGSMRVTRNKTRQQRDEEPEPSGIDAHLLLKESHVSSSSPDRRNQDIQFKEMDHSLEESLMAFFDTQGVRDPGEIEEDKLTFLDATYARSVIRADASVPTQKMYEAIFRNIQENQSAELTMESFRLLIDLEKRNPQVAIAEDLDKASGKITLKLDVDKRIWSPLEQAIENSGDEDQMEPASSAEGQVSLNLVILVETIAVNVAGQGRQAPTSGIQSRSRPTSLEDATDKNVLGQFLIFQHLVSLIQKDFHCRLQVSEASMDADAVQTSYLYRLLYAVGSKKRKRFLSNLVSILNPITEQMQEVASGDEEGDGCITPQTTAKNGVFRCNKSGLLPSPTDFSHLAYTLLFMSMEIDTLNKKWSSINGLRRKGRFVFIHDLLDLFSDASDLEAYLQALDSPRTKLRFIIDYFVYHSKGTVGKGLEVNIGRETMWKLLACFAEGKFQKFLHKFGEHVLPLLLAHAFQAFLIIHAEASGEDHENERGLHQGMLLQVSQSLLDTLTELRDTERQTEMLPVAEVALGMAESILGS